MSNGKIEVKPIQHRKLAINEERFVHPTKKQVDVIKGNKYFPTTIRQSAHFFETSALAPETPVADEEESEAADDNSL